MRIKRLALIYLAFPVTLCAAYLATPFFAAYRLQAAVERSDTAALAGMADWPAVRASLKTSIGGKLGLVKEARTTTAGESPGLWQRMKTRYATSMVDSTIDRYVTPEGLPKLYAYRRTYNEDMRPKVGLAGPRSALHGTWLAGGMIDAALTTATRLEGASFVSPTDFRLQVRDRYEAQRSYRLSFQLRGWSWALTGISVIGAIDPSI